MDEPFAATEIPRLERLRETAAELAIDADLAAGRHQEVLAEIEARLGRNPMRERLHAQRMLALYRCGRRPRRSRRTDTPAARWSTRSASSPGLTSSACTRRSCGRTRHWTSSRPRPSSRARSTPPSRRRWSLASVSCDDCGRAGGGRRDGAGSLVAVVGAHGSGKTHLAAALAATAHRDGARVEYAAGAQPPERALAALARTRDAQQPTLLVLDDADRAPADVLAALRELSRGLGRLPALVLATGQKAATLERLEPHELIGLEPLGADAVRAIAGHYAPADADVPVDALLATSGGVARSVHEAASGWARREAVRQVDAVAERAAVAGTEARALEAELAGRVVSLQAARERAGRVARTDVPGPVLCPYKGLAPFEIDDAECFFGREQLVAELVARLVGTRLLGVVGPSGSGKSSVVRAGLLPALAGGALPGSDVGARVDPSRRAPDARASPCASGRPRPRRARRRPARGAVHRLQGRARAHDVRRRAGPNGSRAQSRRRPRCARGLLRSLRRVSGACCAAGRQPRPRRPDGPRRVAARDRAAGAARRTAARARTRGRLLADCEGEPGALPLLSTALLELWQRRDGRHVRLAAYERTGGVRGAVARLAEAAYERLEPDQRVAARRLLLRLAAEEGGAAVRRRVALDELGDDSGRVLDVLAESRLVTVSEGSVEVAHEALLREWPRLAGWLEEDRDGQRIHRHLARAAREWRDGGRDRAELYRGARLASALEWRAAHEPELNAIEQQFLDASRLAGERERRRLRLVLAGVIALLAVATVAALAALDQRGQARSEARAAQAQRLGAQALNDEELDRALLVARQGVALDDAPGTRDNLLAVLRRAPAAMAVMRGDGDVVNAVALHPDGRTLAIGDDDGTLVFLDAATRRRLEGRTRPA